MKFFLDTADISEIERLNESGMVDGVTTNPSLWAKSGIKLGSFEDTVKEIASLITGPVSVECTYEEYEPMLKQGRKIAKLATNIAVKVPLTFDGLRVCRILANDGVSVNVTLCFSGVQALLAAKAGARYVSPFVGRLDDIGSDGMDLIGEIADIFGNYDFQTEILVASVRHPQHIAQAAQLGADVATLPPDVLSKLYNHPLTDKGLATFAADWQKLQKQEG